MAGSYASVRTLKTWFSVDLFWTGVEVNVRMGAAAVVLRKVGRKVARVVGICALRSEGIRRCRSIDVAISTDGVLYLRGWFSSSTPPARPAMLAMMSRASSAKSRPPELRGGPCSELVAYLIHSHATFLSSRTRETAGMLASWQSSPSPDPEFQ